ncbi:hypothetical protein FSP39_019779 [Pinctada imbricata]|uniref:Uncharacterized protein n=1 Tax=Pinctada imbricata TaxID=66713 RepID=A0AA88XNB4_PINIB|nr:hypothetical protein FSP39_019779 [Pinctada imbricata]
MEERKRQCDPTKHLERPLHGVGLCEIEEMSEAYRSKFSFELVKRIMVPNLFWNENEHEININISSISCFDGKNCIVAPNGDKLVLIYDKDGNEMLRDIIHFRVVDIAMGLKGYPLIIENGTSTIYEYRFGESRKLFRSQPLLPYAISSLNDGKVVLVGTVSTRTLLEAEFQRRGAMRVYKYNGQIVSEALREHGEYLFDFPFHVCVSLENNDIYVGDINKKKIMHFKKDCTFISSYTASEMRDAYMLVGGISVENTHFLLSLTYIQTSKLLLASYHSGFGGGRIHVLSPNLEFLGLFHADQNVGVPVGMSIDDDGNVFFGDNSDGIIRVFKLSEYVNNL